MKKASWLFFIAFVVFLLPITCLAAGGSTQLQLIREKVGSGKLSDHDIKAIGAFVDEQLELMLFESDIAVIVDLRCGIVNEKGESPSQYWLEYIRAVKKGMESTFKNLEHQPDSARKTYLQLNLLILASEMESLQMAEFGLGMMSNPNAAIQYWAIKTIASPAIAEQLSSPVTEDPDLKAKIMATLKASVRKGLYSSSLAEVIGFLNSFENKSANELLCQITEKRIADYESWSVEYELLEADLLKALAKKTVLANSVPERAACAKAYAQLYSYVIQRFLLGQTVLSEESLMQLTSVIADVEATTIGPGKFLDMNQQSLKQAIIQKDYDDLLNEHDKLLGSENRAGRLGLELKFDYGKDSKGDPITAPKKLVAPKMSN